MACSSWGLGCSALGSGQQPTAKNPTGPFDRGVIRCLPPLRLPFWRLIMYKALCVVALLVATIALSSTSKSGALPAPFPSPLIVAKGRILNQNAPISTTTIFTPTQSGLYRLSLYGTITQPN